MPVDHEPQGTEKAPAAAMKAGSANVRSPPVAGGKTATKPRASVVKKSGQKTSKTAASRRRRRKKSDNLTVGTKVRFGKHKDYMVVQNMYCGHLNLTLTHRLLARIDENGQRRFAGPIDVRGRANFKRVRLADRKGQKKHENEDLLKTLDEPCIIEVEKELDGMLAEFPYGWRRDGEECSRRQTVPRRKSSASGGKKNSSTSSATLSSKGEEQAEADSASKAGDLPCASWTPALVETAKIFAEIVGGEPLTDLDFKAGSSSSLRCGGASTADALVAESLSGTLAAGDTAVDKHTADCGMNMITPPFDDSGGLGPDDDDDGAPGGRDDDLDPPDGDEASEDVLSTSSEGDEEGDGDNDQGQRPTGSSTTSSAYGAGGMRMSMPPAPVPARGFAAVSTFAGKKLGRRGSVSREGEQHQAASVLLAAKRTTRPEPLVLVAQAPTTAGSKKTPAATVMDGFVLSIDREKPADGGRSAEYKAKVKEALLRPFLEQLKQKTSVGAGPNKEPSSPLLGPDELSLVIRETAKRRPALAFVSENYTDKELREITAAVFCSPRVLQANTGGHDSTARTTSSSDSSSSADTTAPGESRPARKRRKSDRAGTSSTAQEATPDGKPRPEKTSTRAAGPVASAASSMQTVAATATRRGADPDSGAKKPQQQEPGLPASAGEFKPAADGAATTGQGSSVLDLKALQRQNTLLQARVEELQSSAAAANFNGVGLQWQNTLLQARVGELQSSAVAANSNGVGLQRQNTLLQARVEELQSRAAKAEDDAAKLSKGMEDRRCAVTALEKELGLEIRKRKAVEGRFQERTTEIEHEKSEALERAAAAETRALAAEERAAVADKRALAAEASAAMAKPRETSAEVPKAQAAAEELLQQLREGRGAEQVHCFSKLQQNETAALMTVHAIHSKVNGELLKCNAALMKQQEVMLWRLAESEKTAQEWKTRAERESIVITSSSRPALRS